jgi:hypothetical protein
MMNVINSNLHLLKCKVILLYINNLTLKNILGWRCEMEDACITHVNFAPDCSLFAVFDGHGYYN